MSSVASLALLLTGMLVVPAALGAPLYVLDPVYTTRTLDVEPTETIQNVKSEIEDSFLNSAAEHVVELCRCGCRGWWR